MGFKCGIVGLPNVGKSTLFNALTSSDVAAENYPFCTIEPKVGRIAVPDERLQSLADLVKPEKILPTFMEFVDIAGLVKGAAQGEGLGNQFLGNIREVDAIAHVVRCFDNDDVTHVAGGVDPVADVETINTELAIADLVAVERELSNIERKIKSGDKAILQTKSVLESLKECLDEARPVRALELDEEDRACIQHLNLLTAKPVLYIGNVNEDGSEDTDHYKNLQKLAAKESAEVVSVCAAMEAEIIKLEGDDKALFLAELNQSEPGLNRVIRAGYQLLGLMTYFTAGPKEVRAWTVEQGALAPQAAGKIHTDFERGFISAEVIHFEDYASLGGEKEAKEAGKVQRVGKDYTVCDGDVIHFFFNV